MSSEVSVPEVPVIAAAAPGRAWNVQEQGWGCKDGAAGAGMGLQGQGWCCRSRDGAAGAGMQEQG